MPLSDSETAKVSKNKLILLHFHFFDFF